MTHKLIYLTHARIPSDKTPYPFILKTCAGFMQEGWAVELWAANRHNPWFAGADPYQAVDAAKKVPIVHVPVIDWMRFIGRLGFVFMIVTYNVVVLFRLRKHRDALVYAHDIRDVVLPVLLGVPMACEIHDYFESSVGLINRVVLPRLKYLIVTNAIKAEFLHKKYRIPRERMLVQPNAVAAKDFDILETRREARERLSLPQDERIIMYTGHLYAWKGGYTLAAAMEFIPNGTLYFVGGTDFDRNALQRFVAENQLPRISFIESQPHEKIPLYLRTADVVVLPNTAKEAVSREETSPVKLFEYLASGTPIVATDLPSVREIVSEKEVIFAKPDDPRDMARAIENAFSADDARKESAISLARKHSWEDRARAISRFVANF